MSTTKDIREMSEVEIEKKLRDTHDAHVNLRLRKQTGQVERPHEFTQMRREIARLETILKEKKLAAATA
jgi:large subunit ribosomal protein L29